MSLTRRWLPPSEWHKLDGTELAGYAPHMDPERTSVAVVENDGGEIVACVGFMVVMHAEGLWGKPGEMNEDAWRLLFEAMNEVGTDANMRGIIGGAATPMMSRLLSRHGGAKLPVDYFTLPIPFGPFAGGLCHS